MSPERNTNNKLYQLNFKNEIKRTDETVSNKASILFFNLGYGSGISQASMGVGNSDLCPPYLL